MEDYSLSGRVFQQLQDDILKGKYQENEELKEAALAEEFSVSRTPVREALRRLELEGLVKIIPNKGAYVTGITEKDIKDIYMIRSLLEGLCARLATENITEEALDELEEIVLLSEFNSKKERSDQVVDLDGKFHEVLYRASDSRILEHVLSDFHRYVKIARATSVKKENRAQESVQEHKEILEAIKSKDADRAEMLANRHILKVIDNMQFRR